MATVTFCWCLPFPHHSWWLVDTVSVGNWYPCTLTWWHCPVFSYGCWWLQFAFIEGGNTVFSHGDWVAAVHFCLRRQPCLLSWLLGATASADCWYPCLLSWWLGGCSPLLLKVAALSLLLAATGTASSLMVADGYRYPDGNLYPCLLTWWLTTIVYGWRSSLMVAGGCNPLLL